MDKLELINDVLISLDYGIESYKQDPPTSDNAYAIKLYKSILEWQKELQLLSELINIK